MTTTFSDAVTNDNGQLAQPSGAHMCKAFNTFNSGPCTGIPTKNATDVA